MQWIHRKCVDKADGTLLMPEEFEAFEDDDQEEE